jgi:signal transduction histidine kinase
VTIRDTGIGIEESELEMIWDRFYKSDESRGRDKTGTGLGLAIVRNIINEHGQSIRVSSKLGEGTAFTFTVAKARSSAVEKQQN